MTTGINNFTYPSLYLKTNVSIQCYDLQYDALTGGLSQGDYCLTLPPLLEDICGCKIPPGGAPVPTPNIDTPMEAPTVAAPTTVPPSPTAGAISVMNQGVIIAGMLLMVTAFGWASWEKRQFFIFSLIVLVESFPLAQKHRDECHNHNPILDELILVSL
jgi:hypothetical protein